MLTTRYHLDEAHLKHYDERLKSWALANATQKTLPSSLYPWTLTDKAGAVSLWPAGGTPLKPVVDFLFTEVPPASGDKGPENPSIITGVSSVNVGRIGKNLLLVVPDNTNWYGISITRQTDGSYLLNGTSTSSQDRFFPLTDCGNISSGPYATLKLDPAKTYTLFATVVSGTITGAASVSAMNSRNTGWIPGRAMSIAGGGTAIATNSASSLVTGEFVCRLNVGSGASFNNVVLQVQLEEGSIATDFEAPMLPADANHVLPLGSTYYGGTLDVASGVMTVTHFLEQLSSSTNIVSTGFSEGQSAYRVGMYLSSSKERMPYPITSLEGYACNSFPVVADPSANSAPCFGLAGGSILTYLCLTKAMLGVGDGATYDVVRSAVLSFLGSHQVKVAGKLATPYTVQLTPTEILSLSQADKYTPRLNTVYTDAQAVQVGYVKSPIRDEYELQQAVIAQGGNV